MIKTTLMNSGGFNSAESFANATEPVRYSMTNDYLFRAVFQSNEKALRGLGCSLLHLKPEEVYTLKISNPIELGKSIYEKQIVLDIKPVMHISFLDFELFPECPEFYATYKFMNVKNCNRYSDKLSISVVNLNRTDLATEEDKAYGTDYWARLFKSTTWEEIKMLAEKNPSIREAANAMYDFTSDEIIREHCEMREEFLRRERTRERFMEIAEERLKEAEVKLKEAQENVKEKDFEIA